MFSICYRNLKVDFLRFLVASRPGNRPIPVRKTGQNCSKTVPEASPEKPEIAYTLPRKKPADLKTAYCNTYSEASTGLNTNGGRSRSWLGMSESDLTK